MTHKYYRYQSQYKKYKTKLHNYLTNKETYNNLIRSINKQRYPTTTQNITLTWINPNEIQHMQMEATKTPTKFRHIPNKVHLHSPEKARFNPHHYAGLTINGQWDTYTKPHKYDRVYKGLKQHLHHNIPLKETEYAYQYKLRQQTYQHKKYLQQEINKTKQLIKSMKKNGFQTRYDLNQLSPNDPPYLAKDQWGITVNKDRNGNYIFNNTAHNRLALSKLLNIKKIPVTIIATHPQATK